jgi:Na+-transporting methylmalonyl-CoA/oxaloacetate decarboxylase gamma subunit
MAEEVILGLRISLIGLAVTFLAMGLVILVMILLVRVFPVKGKPEQEDLARSRAEPEAANEQALEEMAVALAVGICLLERQGELEYQNPSLGKLLEE